jgi:hypothetical protein
MKVVCHEMCDSAFCSRDTDTPPIKYLQTRTENDRIYYRVYEVFFKKLLFCYLLSDFNQILCALYLVQNLNAY